MRTTIVLATVFAVLSAASPNAAGTDTSLITRADQACGHKGVHCPVGQKWCPGPAKCVDCALSCPGPSDTSLVTRDDEACSGSGIHCPAGQKWCQKRNICVDCALKCPGADDTSSEEEVKRDLELVARACDHAGVHCPKGQKWCKGVQRCVDCALKCPNAEKRDAELDLEMMAMGKREAAPELEARACDHAGVHCPKGQKWCEDVQRCVDCALRCPQS